MGLIRLYNSADMARILIVKLSAIGDVIHCLPLAARLKDALPGVVIDWLVEAPGAPLLQNNPGIDQVYVLPKKDWLRKAKGGQPSVVQEVLQFMGRLRANKYDGAIDAQGLFKSAFLARMSGAPKVFGFKGTREMAPLLATHSLDVGDYFAPGRHVVDLNLQLADFVASTMTGASLEQKHHTHVCFPLPAPTPEAFAKIDSLISGVPGAKHGDTTASADINADLDKSPVVAVIPGTTWDTKIWQDTYWSRLIERLCAELSARVIILGGPADREKNQHIYRMAKSNAQSEIKCLSDITGETNLIELVALYKNCDLVIGADTGPLHLACATGHPAVLAVHGASPWGRNGPKGPTGSELYLGSAHLNLSCQPCFSKRCRLGTIECLKDLPVEEVFQKAKGLLELSLNRH